MMAGPTIRRSGQSATAQIQDVTPTALHLLGLPVPAVMDGQVLKEMITAEYLAAHPIDRVQDGDDRGMKRSEWEQMEDEEQVAERLRALGYLE
jgi:hypothetical protein